MKKEYINGNTRVTIDLTDGTKERYTDDNEFKPAFAESMDCTITYKCDGGCEFCYAGCTPNGEHANLESEYVLNTFIPSLEPYTELALNGNDLSHPQLKGFLKRLKDREVIANLTVNQKHFMKNKELLHKWYDEGLFKGLGISLTNSKEKGFVESVKEFPTAVIHTIAGILTPHDISVLQDNQLKLLILGYKKKGRGTKWYESNSSYIDLKIAILHTILPGIIKRGLFNVISFDNLALEQLKVKEILKPEVWEDFYMGDDGSFTYYVDLVKNEFALSSLSTETYNISNKNTKEMFYCLR